MVKPAPGLEAYDAQDQGHLGDRTRVNARMLRCLWSKRRVGVSEHFRVPGRRWLGHQVFYCFHSGISKVDNVADIFVDLFLEFISA